MKKTPNQIREELRRQLATQYTTRVNALKETIASYRTENERLREQYNAEHQARLEAEEKVKQLEDWVNRLQEFMDMSDDDRKAYVENLKKTKELDDLLQKFGFYDKMISRIFS